MSADGRDRRFDCAAGDHRILDDPIHPLRVSHEWRAAAPGPLWPSCRSPDGASIHPSWGPRRPVPGLRCGRIGAAESGVRGASAAAVASPTRRRRDRSRHPRRPRPRDRRRSQDRRRNPRRRGHQSRLRQLIERTAVVLFGTVLVGPCSSGARSSVHARRDARILVRRLAHSCCAAALRGEHLGELDRQRLARRIKGRSASHNRFREHRSARAGSTVSVASGRAERHAPDQPAGPSTPMNGALYPAPRRPSRPQWPSSMEVVAPALSRRDSASSRTTSRQVPGVLGAANAATDAPERCLQIYRLGLVVMVISTVTWPRV